MGISPVRVAIAGFNEWKPLRQQHDWIVKRYDVWQQSADDDLHGLSRIQADGRSQAGRRHRVCPAYNGGVNGSADFGEIRSYLQYYLRPRQEFASRLHRGLCARAVRSPRNEADRGRHPLLDAALPKRARPPMIQFGLANDLADFASVFFSVSGLKSAVRTVSPNLVDKGICPLRARSDDGFAPIALAHAPLQRPQRFQFCASHQVHAA